MRRPLVLALAAGLSAATASTLAAQSPDRGPDLRLDTAARAQVLDGVLRELRAGYVFPDRAAEMERVVRARAARGEYERLTGARAFADSLTAHLQAVSRDKHLHVFYSSEALPEGDPEAPPTGEARRAQEDFARRVNFGFEKMERLPGNVGYLEIRSFGFNAASVESALAAAMAFLGNTDALIIDVRRNGGGEPEMVAAVCSYLMPKDVVINTFYWRPANRWDESRTVAVSGRHYGTTKPVYVLTSHGTFSGAEEFAYDIQTQRRGEIVGDTTGGGAHPGGPRRVTAHFGVWVPSGRPVNPVTKTNWEGTGVRPDVPVPSAEALRTAHRRAIERLLRDAGDADWRAELQQLLESLSRPAPTS